MIWFMKDIEVPDEVDPFEEFGEDPAYNTVI